MKILNIIPTNSYTTTSFLGHSSAINSGDLAVISSPGANVFGKVYVYKKYQQEWNWKKIQEIEPFEGYEGDYFGHDISINNEGNTIAISAPNANQGYGVVYIYNKNNDIWYQTEKIEGDIDAGFFGQSISLNNLGNKLVVGSAVENGTGFADLYEYNQNSWEKKVRFFDTGIGHSTSGTFYGNKVLINTGDFIFIGARGQNNTGVIHVYSETGNWNKFSIISGTGSKDSNFGKNFYITSDSKNILIGAPGDNNLSGSAYLFKYNNNSGNWIYDKKFVGSRLNISGQVSGRISGDVSGFGECVAINDNLNLAFISSLNDSGIIYSYARLYNQDWQNFIRIDNNFVKGFFEIDKFDGFLGQTTILNRNFDTMIVGNPSYSASAGSAFIISAPWDNNIDHYAINESDFHNTGICDPILKCKDCCGISGGLSIITGYRNNLNNLNLELYLNIKNLNLSPAYDIYKFYNYSAPIYTSIYSLGRLNSIYSTNILIKNIKPINNLINLKWKIFNLGKEYNIYTGININNY